MKLALYKTEYGSDHPFEVCDYIESSDEYTRISGIIEVEFNMFDCSVINKAEIAIIDRKINKVMADSELEINRLKQRKSELLAITDQS